MRAATQAVSCQLAHAALPEPRPLVLDVGWHRRQIVGDVVDEDEDLDTVGRGNNVLAHDLIVHGRADLIKGLDAWCAIRSACSYA